MAFRVLARSSFVHELVFLEMFPRGWLNCYWLELHVHGSAYIETVSQLCAHDFRKRKISKENLLMLYAQSFVKFLCCLIGVFLSPTRSGNRIACVNLHLLAFYLMHSFLPSATHIWNAIPPLPSPPTFTLTSKIVLRAGWAPPANTWLRPPPIPLPPASPLHLWTFNPGFWAYHSITKKKMHKHTQTTQKRKWKVCCQLQPPTAPSSHPPPHPHQTAPPPPPPLKKEGVFMDSSWTWHSIPLWSKTLNRLHVPSPGMKAAWTALKTKPTILLLERDQRKLPDLLLSQTRRLWLFFTHFVPFSFFFPPSSVWFAVFTFIFFKGTSHLKICFVQQVD